MVMVYVRLPWARVEVGVRVRFMVSVALKYIGLPGRLRQI